jgi:hypothetical protein
MSVVGPGLRTIGTGVLSALIAGLVAASAPAAQGPSANLSVNIIVGADASHSSIIQRDTTIAVRKLTFAVGVNIENQGPDEATAARVRLVLPTGLHWGADAPDPSENCVATDTVADCRAPTALDATAGARRAAGWIWNVVASTQGRYVLRAELVESTPRDPDPSDDTSTVTALVKTSIGPVVASAARITPSIPRAGAPVSARVRVTVDGTRVTTHAPICTARLPNIAFSWIGRATLGVVTCVYRTPTAARGKTLRGTVGFTAQGKRFVRPFAVTLH